MAALSEMDKMVSGQEYNCLDGELQSVWQARQNANTEMNRSGRWDGELLPHVDSQAAIKLPLYISYGQNLYVAPQVFINVNVTLQDNAPITIGRQTMIGPNVQCYTASHPLDAVRRCQGWEQAKAIHIGERVWVGGGAIILPGVTIGDEAVVGAGAVVTKDVAPRTVVGGNPARVIRQIEG
ncbi:sugar O-acetyltransferase [Shewanella insulae]|uniref:sugar O-acetyltransferase n=1 Tax=Shewanella insulae TaxID=2681496 RepID=UPI001EFD8165|nr:sugar O-acetyltransferase [Shewanella insulae]MCG9756187.1 sugar O-acetyltransferase [Shewanella insulae]